MSDEYTPTTADVEAIARVLAAIESRKGMKSLDEVLAYQAEKWRRHTYEAEQLLDEMRPWLAARDREVAAKALRDAAFDLARPALGGATYEMWSSDCDQWLRARADRIELQASEKGASDGEQ